MLTAAVPRRRASCPAPRPDSTGAGRRAARRARASPRSRSRRCRPRARAKPCPSSSITAPRSALLRVRRMLTRLGARVLDDVRQRLLHDPVERGRDLVRKLARRRGARAKSTAMPVRRSSVSVSRSSAGTSPKSSSAFGRKLDRQAAHILQRVRPTSSRRRASATRDSSPRALLERAQAEQDRGERLPGLVVELACEPAPLDLLAATTRRSASRATRSERSTATAAREANVSARRRSSSLKRASAAELVVRDEHADRAVADESGTQNTLRGRPAGASRSGRPRGRRARSRHVRSAALRAPAPLFELAPAQRLARATAPPSHRRRPRNAARPGPREEHRDKAGVEQIAQPRGDRSSSGSRSVSVASALPTSFSDSSRADQRVAAS